MIVGAQKGIFKEHGLDVRLKIVKSGTEIVNALKSKQGRCSGVAGAVEHADIVQGARSYLVKRGGGYLSYMMVSTFQDETIKSKPDLVEKFALGLAASAHYTRTHRAEAIDLFAKAVPGVDVEITKKAIQHLSYDPCISKINMAAFNAAQESLIQLGSSKADKRLDLPKVVLVDYMMKIEKSHPQYFKDLKKVAY